MDMSNMESTPQVSVYISTYNRLERLKRSINSVLNQDFNDFEILVCDDASTDGTKEYMEALALENNKVRYLRNNENKGACATRNLGIFSARGKYITGLDDDDEFTHDRLSYLLKHWHDKYAFLCANFVNVYPGRKPSAFYRKTTKIGEFNYKNMLFKNVASNQVFTLTCRLREIGGFDPRVKRLQDWDTWLRLSYKFGAFSRLPKCNYIMHHDHAPHEYRVSESADISDSLISLSTRNKGIYSDNEIIYMKFLASHINRGPGLREKIRWGCLKLYAKCFLL